MLKPNLILNKYLKKKNIYKENNIYDFLQIIFFISFILFLLISLYFKNKYKLSKKDKYNSIIKFYKKVYNFK